VKLLVTGGAGFIGSNFIRYWAREYPSDSILNVDLLTYAGDLATVADVARDAGDRYVFARGDIADATFVSEVVGLHRPDVIVNFAAESHNSRAILDPTIFVRTNVLGTQTLLEAARRHDVPRFHHISTCEVYGDLKLDSTELFTEESPNRPRTPYNASKAAADMLVRAYNLTYGLATTISNCANNYGPWQYPEKIISLFTTNALDDMPLPLYRQSQNRREWLHVDDHCRAIDLILREGRIGETYNVGSGDERSIEQIADAVLEVLEKPSSLKTYVEDRPSHDRRYLLDHSKIEAELGWNPRVTFEDGLRVTIDWYRDHRPWWEQKKRETQATLDEFHWRKNAPAGSRG
jgi:dTDP-glucose 4,6-dehydratase